MGEAGGAAAAGAGLGPLGWILPAVSLGANAASGFFAPEGTEVQSFAGQNRRLQSPGGYQDFSIDPGTHLALGLQKLQQMFDQTQARSRQPVTQQNTLPSSFVQQPATFSGGGLPMDIGVHGFDLANPLFTPAEPPGGFGFDIGALINQIQNGGVGPGTGGGGGGGGNGPVMPFGPAPPGDIGPRERDRGRIVDDGTGNDFILEQGPVTAPPFPYFPPTGQDPIVEPPEGELPVVGPPVGGPPPRTRPRDRGRIPPGGGIDPRQGAEPPGEEVEWDIRVDFPGFGAEFAPQGGGEFYQMPQTSPQAPQSNQPSPTMQDALEMLGFPMKSLLRRS